MKIFKIIADERPECCLLCPIIRQQKGKCGAMIQKSKDGWKSQYKGPDERCLIEVRKEGC